MLVRARYEAKLAVLLDDAVVLLGESECVQGIRHCAYRGNQDRGHMDRRKLSISAVRIAIRVAVRHLLVLRCESARHCDTLQQPIRHRPRLPDRRSEGRRNHPANGDVGYTPGILLRCGPGWL